MVWLSVLGLRGPSSLGLTDVSPTQAKLLRTLSAGEVVREDLWLERKVVTYLLLHNLAASQVVGYTGHPLLDIITQLTPVTRR